jgi:uncharacterized OB-fold protein
MALPPWITDPTQSDATFFWIGLAERRILIQRCAACGRHRFPPMPSCPYCASSGGEVVPVDGAGTIYSLVRVHRAFAPQFADAVPYTVAVVELPERVRLVGVIAGDATRIGDAVAPSFRPHDGWTELRFTVMDRKRGDVNATVPGENGEAE